MIKDQFKGRAQSSDMLAARLDANQRMQARDFGEWLFTRLNVQPGEKILDVGCGTGAQTKQFLNMVGQDGHVCSLDISEDSINAIKQELNEPENLSLAVADMAALGDLIDDVFPVKKFDLAHSTYALYYAKEPKKVLDIMKNALNPDGRIVVFVPSHPHGMVEYARQFHEIPSPIDDSLSFGPKVLEPHFRECFENVAVHFFKNSLAISSVDDFMALYRSATYFNEAAENKLITALEAHFGEHQTLVLEKNGYLITGTDAD